MKKTNDAEKSSGSPRKSLVPVDFNLCAAPSRPDFEKFHVLLRKDGSIASDTKLSDHDLYYLGIVESSEDTASSRGVKTVEPCWHQLARDGVHIDHYNARHKTCDASKTRERIADLVFTITTSESASPVMVLECKHRTTKHKNGKLTKKTHNNHEAARRGIEAFIEKNLDTYSQWISLAASMSIDDRGIIAGPKKKKYLSR